MHAATSPEYHDRWIDCTDQELRIRGYYFPGAPSGFPYGKIGAVRRVKITAPRGKAASGARRRLASRDSVSPVRPVQRDLGPVCSRA